MGLDMYLNERVFVGQKYAHRKVTGVLSLKTEEEELCSGIDNLSEVVFEAAYWRKSNQIHNWFIENVQDGIDECQSSCVSIEQLKELDSLCEKVLANPSLAPTLLPTHGGFFFGNTEYNEYYFSDLEDTRAMLKDIFEHNHGGEFYYQSSW